MAWISLRNLSKLGTISIVQCFGLWIHVIHMMNHIIHMIHSRIHVICQPKLVNSERCIDVLFRIEHVCDCFIHHNYNLCRYYYSASSVAPFCPILECRRSSSRDKSAGRQTLKTWSHRPWPDLSRAISDSFKGAVWPWVNESLPVHAELGSLPLSLLVSACL